MFENRAEKHDESQDVIIETTGKLKDLMADIGKNNQPSAEADFDDGIKTDTHDTGNNGNDVYSDIGSILTERFKDDNSRRGILFNNIKIRRFLDKSIRLQENDFKRNTSTYESEIKSFSAQNVAEKKIENDSSSETFDDYKLRMSTYENYIKFVQSEEWITFTENEINNHIDESTGDFYSNLPISETFFNLKCKNAFNRRLFKEYNLMHYGNEYGDSDIEHVDSNIERDDSNKETSDMDIISFEIDNIVAKHLKNKGNNFDKNLINDLETLLFQGGNNLSISEMLRNYNNTDSFKQILRDSITTFSGLLLGEDNLKNNNFSLNTGFKEGDLQLRSYLFIYGKLFFPDIFEVEQSGPYYENCFIELSLAILDTNGDERIKKFIGHNRFLEREKKAEQERKEREEKRRQEIARRNKELNERNQHTSQIEEKNDNNETQTKSLNLNTATGAELAAEADLGKDLSEYNVNIEESEHKQEWMKESAFPEAWNDFIKSHDDIKTIITQEQMHRLFDIKNGSIKHLEWENFKKMNPLLKGMNQPQIDKIYNTLNSFSSNLNNVISRLANDSSAMKIKMNETIKTYAIGAVIDNVRDTFSMVSNKNNADNQNGSFKGFELNAKNPIKKVGDDIIISGFFDGSDVRVRYNLKTGQLFMNSFLHKLDVNKIKIGANSLTDLQIGQIRPFNDVLNNYYKLPPKSSPKNVNHVGATSGAKVGNSGIHGGRLDNNMQPKAKQINPKDDMDSRKDDVNDVLNAQIDLISDVIKANTKGQTYKNSAINNFLMTFNIKSNYQEFDSLDFNDGSNLFDVIQLLDKSDPSTLEYFNNTFMPTVMEYSGLKWGETNVSQDINNKKSEKIFKYNGENENINLLKDKMEDFNPHQFSGIANFDSSYQLGFADLIKQKIASGNKPNWNLDIKKMSDFIKDLEAKHENDDETTS